jgi:hypothetical protein
MTWGWIVLAALVLLIVAWYLSTTAARLDRLNKRVEDSIHSLETQLLRRASVATELAGSGLLDPASSAVLADAAHAVRVAPQDASDERAAAESNLTAVLDALFADPADVAALRSLPGGEELVDEVDSVTRRLAMSRRFLNDGIRANRDLRARRMVRWFRLAGTSVLITPLEFLDEPPAGFGTR